MIMMNPIDETKQLLSGLVAKACRAAIAAGELPDVPFDAPAAETPKDAQNGDLSSTFALARSKAMSMPPRKIAETVVARMDLSGTVFDKVWIAGPGFINVTFGPDWYASVLGEIEQAGIRTHQEEKDTGEQNSANAAETTENNTHRHRCMYGFRHAVMVSCTEVAGNKHTRTRGKTDEHIHEKGENGTGDTDGSDRIFLR